MDISLSQSMDIFSKLETNLQRSLNPVSPNPEFITHLHQRLTRPATVILEQPGKGPIWILVVVGGLVSGVVLVWLLRRLKVL